MFAILLVAAVLSPPQADATTTAAQQVDTAWSVLQGGVVSSAPDRRLKAIRALQLLPKSPKAQEWAEKALKDNNASVRAEAASVLGAMGASSARPSLRDALNDRELKVVLSAANSLYVLKDPIAYEVYYALLTGERKGNTGLIQSQLDTLHDKKAMEKLMFETGIGFVPFGGMGWEAWKTISRNDAAPVRAQAADRLITDPDPKTGEALAKSCSDKKWQVRAAAANAIARRADPALESSVVPLMTDDNDTVRYTAAAAVIRLSTEERPHPRPSPREKKRRD